MDTSIALLEQSVTHITESIGLIDRKMESRFNTIDSSLEKTTTRLEKLNDQAWTNFLWLLGTVFSVSCAGLGIILKGLGIM